MLAHRRALAAVFVLVALAGCGGGDADPPEDVRGTEPGRPAEWDAASVPLARGADTELLTAVDGDTIVLLTADDEGVVSSAVATGDGAFATGPPLETGAGYLRLGGLVRFDGAWWAAGPGGTRAVPSRPDDWETTFDLHLVRSTDGLTWTEVATTGLEGPAEITGLVATDDGLVAVGHDQSGNLDGGDMEAGFGPRAWRSADGTSWEAVPLAADDAEWGPSALLATDDGLLAVGGADDGTVAWRSDDAGRSWAEVELDGLGTARLREVVLLGDALLAAGAGEGGEDAPDGTPFVARSTDGGRTWAPIDVPPAESPEAFGMPLFVAGDLVLTLVSVFFDGWEDPTACYADITQCQSDSAAVLYEGDGEGAWSRIDLAGLDLDEYEDVHGVIATDDRLVLWSAGESVVRTWSTPADATLPVVPEPTRDSADVRLLGDEEEPEVGVTYAVPLYVHCGMDWLYLGGEHWQRTDDGPDVETGAGQSAEDGWPVAGQTIYGFATRVEVDVVEYTIGDGEVIATYGPAREEPPGCD